MLSCTGLHKHFAGVTAFDDVSLEVNAGEIVGVLGPNGSGKTTLVNVLSGYYRPDAGSIRFGSHDITNWPTYRVRRAGLVRTFQNLRLYDELTVEDNLLLAFHNALCDRGSRSVIGAMVRTRRSRRAQADAGARVRSALDELALGHIAREQVGGLPYGTKKRLELARALLAEPRILLLDEPTAGLSPMEIDYIRPLLHEHAARGLGILLIEHRLEWVMDLCDRLVVLDAGAKIAEGTSAEIATNADFIRAYIGE